MKNRYKKKNLSLAVSQYSENHTHLPFQGLSILWSAFPAAPGKVSEYLLGFSVTMNTFGTTKGYWFILHLYL